MKSIKVILTALLIYAVVPAMAQTNVDQKNKKDDARAKVEMVNGQSALVLKPDAHQILH